MCGKGGVCWTRSPEIGVARHTMGVANITHVTLCRVIQHVLLEDQNIPYARVQNRAGNFVLPGQANFSTLGLEFTLPQSVTSPDWVSVILGNSGESTPACLSCLNFLVTCLLTCYT